MNYYFKEEHEIFRAGLRDFLNKEVQPYIEEWEEQRKIPKSIWKKFGEMGYLGLNFPEKYGGVDADFWYSVVFVEEVSKCWSGGFAAAVTVQQFMSSPYIWKHGSDFLKEKYLTKAIAGEGICAIAITEPGAGSDVANIKTTAIRQGDHYVVNGSKVFITNGVYGDYIIAVVKTAPEKGAAGVSLLLIERNAPGVEARKLKKLGWHASDTAELSFDEVKVPVENLIGQEGMGFYYLMDGLQLERLVGAIGFVAGCDAALAYSLQYMSEREAFGRPINKFQVLRHRVAQMASEIEATRFFVYHCCRLHHDGQTAVKECSMAKLLTSELTEKIATQCLQFFGGYGYMEEYKMARLFRDSRIGTIGGGTSEIMREIIAKMVIDDVQYRKTGGQNGTIPASGKNDNLDSIDIKNEIKMSLESTISSMAKKAADAPPLGSTLKFELGDECIFIDGTGDSNVVSADNKDADCKISMALDDFNALLAGDLNPMSAFMSRKIKVKGDMGVAMKLQSLL